MKPIISIKCRLLRIWMYGDNSYEVEIVRESHETFYIKFPPSTEIDILADCKMVHVNASHICCVNCTVDINPDTQYIKIY